MGVAAVEREIKTKDKVQFGNSESAARLTQNIIYLLF